VKDFAEVPTAAGSVLIGACFVRSKRFDQFCGTPAEITKELVDETCKRLDRVDELVESSIATSSFSAETVSPDLEADHPITAEAPPLYQGEQNILSDVQILARVVASGPGNLFVSPLLDPLSQLGASSLNVRLGTEIYITQTLSTTHIDLQDPERVKQQKKQYFRLQRVPENGAFVLHPGEFALASTLEYFRFPRDLAGRIEGRSSIGRYGLQVHATAGFVDPGFEGTLTFELMNTGRLPIRLPAGLQLGQLCFFPVHGVQVAYNERPESKYVGSTSVAMSKIEEDRKLKT
jgi:dCTP deaminase